MIPHWAPQVLATPGSHRSLSLSGTALIDEGGDEAAILRNGVVHFGVNDRDPSIAYYRAVGGARFAERASVPYAMTSLDTPAYHSYLNELMTASRDELVVDVGGGDGRNTVPWLEAGYERVVVVDAAGDALHRLSERVRTSRPEWTERLLLIEADARALPLRDDIAGRVVAVETLAYLNQDYEVGLGEIRRVLTRTGSVLISERDYEAALLTCLFYAGGVEGMLSLGGGRDLVDGVGGSSVRSRCFTRAEFVSMIEHNGLEVVSVKGISAVSLVLGYLRSKDALGASADELRPRVIDLLDTLGRTGLFLRAHVATARIARSSSQ